MSDAKVAREVLSSYAKSKVANPVIGTPDPQKLQSAGQLERTIALVRPSDGASRTPAEMKTWTVTPEYWFAGGELVANALEKDPNRPLTCILFAYLSVYTLKSTAPKFGVPIEVVEIKKLHDNHYVLVAGRTAGEIDGKLSEWNEDAFVIDLWGHCQGLGDMVAQPPAIIVNDMKDYPRRTVVTIPPWGV